MGKRKIKSVRLARSAAILWCLALLPAALRANAVFNGGFETGDLTGWTLTNSSQFDAVCQPGEQIGAAYCMVNSGDYAVTFGHYGGVTTLSQVLATTPGASYDLNFYLANDNPSDGGVTTFDVMWDGVDVYSLSSPQPSFSYTSISLYVTATSNSTTLSFLAQQDPSQWFLDDVSAQGVPEPATTLTVGLTLIGAGLLRRSRRGRFQKSEAHESRRKSAA